MEPRKITRKSWILLAAVAGLVLVAALVVDLSAQQSGSASELRQLNANAQKWSSLGVSHYRLQVHVSCFCPFTGRMPVTVEVRDGAIVSAVDTTGSEVPADDALRTLADADLLTVQGLFEYARRALDDADKTEITYDSTFGYPTSINVDWIELAVDDEMAVQASGLQILP